ncbi:class I SAM-dependent methyltransferase [Streptomyces sp. NPDC006510]|uniref:class I SAM-dependent methyltransferase n=1 Tax=Streptomyces sp. NPDC006510 TaxID=3155600 RepID=UPI0033BE796B
MGGGADRLDTCGAVERACRELPASISSGPGRPPWQEPGQGGAQDHGGPFPDGACLELGSGTGLFTQLLRSTFPHVISVDLSEQMLSQAVGRSPERVRADATALPPADAQVSAVAAIDMLLYPAATARVLAPNGVLLWISRLGEDGPLHCLRQTSSPCPENGMPSRPAPTGAAGPSHAALTEPCSAGEL